jgi:hypothetical protein
MARYSALVHNHLALAAQVSLTAGQEHFMRLAGRTVSAPVPVQLILDTGSARCALLPSVLDRLQPIQYRPVRHETALASTETSLCWVRLEFPSTRLAAIPVLAIVRAPLPPSLSSFHGVIGRDVLRQWESFRYQGRRGRLTIHDTPSWLLRWIAP